MRASREKARFEVFTLIVVLTLAAASCGDGDSAATTTEPAATTPATTTTEPAPTTTATTSPTTTTTTTLPPTTTTTGGPTAGDALGGFFAAAEDLDARIRAAADMFNGGFDPDAGTLTEDAKTAIVALIGEPQRVAEEIPAGMSVELETAVLAVYADLDSRIAALRGAEAYLDSEPAIEEDLQYALDCLAHGSVSAARFDAHIADARASAASEPVPEAAADSEEAGILAVRIASIESMNSGCEACGGVEYDEPIAVDWEGLVVGDNVGFTATFEDGRWVVRINAC